MIDQAPEATLITGRKSTVAHTSFHVAHLHQTMHVSVEIEPDLPYNPDSNITLPPVPNDPLDLHQAIQDRDREIENLRKEIAELHERREQDHKNTSQALANLLKEIDHKTDLLDEARETEETLRKQLHSMSTNPISELIRTLIQEEIANNYSRG